eukprot:8757759-Pyramimonas_sp.AAC.1
MVRKLLVRAVATSGYWPLRRLANQTDKCTHKRMYARDGSPGAGVKLKLDALGLKTKLGAFAFSFISGSSENVAQNGQGSERLP